MVHSSRLLRVGLIAFCIIVVVLGFTFWSWSFTTSRLNSARSNSVFPSPAEGMLTLVQSGYVGIQETRILGAEPNVWFVTACVSAKARTDGSPVGAATHDFDSPGSYFVDTHEGWVMMPETSSPLFVGFWMPIFDLAGDDIAQPFHDPSAEPKRRCVRQAG